jgi:hypothetical protein
VGSGPIVQFGAAGLAVLGGTLLTAACGDSDERGRSATRPMAHSANERPCEVGGKPSDPRVPATARAIVLGCAKTPDATLVAVYSFRDAGGPCLNIAGLPGGTRACGRAPSEREPPSRAAIGGAAVVRRSPAAPLELYGETASNVRRVLVRYRLRGRPGQRRASLILVHDRAALRAARIREPFGYFIGVVPPRAGQVFAVALDRSSHEVGRLGFDRLVREMHPTVFIATEK